MKIAISASGPSLDHAADARFGRCPAYLIVDTDTMGFEAVDNPHRFLGGGAGIEAAQLVAAQGVGAVVTGNCGPNAYRVLNAAGVQVLTGATGSVRDAVRQFTEGSLTSIRQANVVSHFGMGGGGRGIGGGRGGGGGRGRGRAGGIGAGAAWPAGTGESRGVVRVAAVNTERCTACGACAEVCPVAAISVEEVAVVNAEVCTACGRCVETCPKDAIRMVPA